MEKETTENDTPTNETEIETPQTQEGDNPQEKSKGDNPLETKELQSALAQKEHFREKFEKAEKELSALKTKPNNLPSSQDPMDVVRLAKSLEGYSEEEVGFIARNASDKSIDGIIEATNDEWVKTAINAKREKVELEKSIPEPSSRQGSALEQKNLEDMSLDEKNQYLSDQGFVHAFPTAKPL